MIPMNDNTFKEAPVKPTPDEIITAAIDTAEAVTGISRSEIIGRSRRRPIVVARWSAMAAARTFGLSLPVIGRGFGRNHTSVLNGLERLPDLDPENIAELVAAATRHRVRTAWPTSRNHLHL